MTTISHMETCLNCGLTNSGALERNDGYELLLSNYIEMAMQCGRQDRVVEIAREQISRLGTASSGGSYAYNGPSSLRALRRMRIARSALEQLEKHFEQHANTKHEFE